MITGIAEMIVVGRAFLVSKGRAVRTVDVQNDLFNGFAFMNFIYPLTSLIYQGFEICRLSKSLGMLINLRRW